MREIHVDLIADKGRELCLEASYVMGEDVRHALTVDQTTAVPPIYSLQR